MKKINIILISLIVIESIVLIALHFTSIARFLFNENNSQNGELIILLVNIVGGIAVFLGVSVAFRRAKAIEKNVLQQTDQIELTRRSQVEERFKNSIEFLANDNPAIVLGGVYSLHAIAKENATYRRVVFDILCSSIRENSIIDNDEQKSIAPSHIIQTIIDLIFKSNQDNEFIYSNISANLSNSYIENYDFRFSILDKANIKGSHISNSSFYKSKLNKVSFEKCNISHCNFNSAKMREVKLSEIEIEKSRFINADLTGASGENVLIEKSMLRKAILDNVEFIEVNFFKSNLSKANIVSSKFSNGIFRSTNLSLADISNSSFEECNLGNARMSKAKLQDCYFYKCNFKCAELVAADFSRAQIDKCFFDEANIYQTIFLDVNFKDVDLNKAINL
jgi:uncharacterized protein YjbI with pentapeptide repeats